MQSKPGLNWIARLWLSLYMYNGEMFDAIGMLEPSGRGELENADVNSYYVDRVRMGYSGL